VGIVASQGVDGPYRVDATSNNVSVCTSSTSQTKQNLYHFAVFMESHLSQKFQEKSSKN